MPKSFGGNILNFTTPIVGPTAGDDPGASPDLVSDMGEDLADRSRYLGTMHQRVAFTAIRTDAFDAEWFTTESSTYVDVLDLAVPGGSLPLRGLDRIIIGVQFYTRVLGVAWGITKVRATFTVAGAVDVPPMMRLHQGERAHTLHAFYQLGIGNDTLTALKLQARLESANAGPLEFRGPLVSECIVYRATV